MFKTDIKQVFDFLKCAENKQALLDLVKKDAYYKSMDRDAYEVIKNYANIPKEFQTEEYNIKKEGVNVCKAIEDLMTDSREEGILIGREAGIKEGIKVNCTLNCTL